MKRIEVTVEDDAVPAVLNNLAQALKGNQLNSLSVQPVRVRTRKGAAAEPTTGNGGGGGAAKAE